MNHKDLIIVGGGLVGLLAAVAAAKKGLHSAVIEKRDYNHLTSQQADGRVSAIALGSKQFLDHCGVWESIAPDAGAIRDIRVTDNHSPFFLHFDHTLAGDEPMGYMVENTTLLKALYAIAQDQPEIDIISSVNHLVVERNNESVTLRYGTDHTITADVLIAADGRNSALRRSAHIKTSHFSYGQTAIVCNVAHTLHHQDTAVEHFMPSGPFAILPLHGGHHSSLVWTEKEEDADYLLSLPKSDLIHALHRRFGEFLGTVSISSPIFHYPLALTYVRKYIAQRLILVGDAAHGIHPIAGQGFNLGIRDIETLTDMLASQKEHGFDLGDKTLLQRYAHARQFDVNSMIEVTHQLNRLFANDLPPVQTMRRLGLAAVQKMTPVKKYFMQRAMGL